MIIYAFASLIALSSESCFIVTQISLHTNIKVFVESTALTIRSLLNCLLLGLWPFLGLKGFCIAEVIFACLYPILYILKIAHLLRDSNMKSSLPIKSLGELAPSFQWSSFPEGSISLLFLFFRQSCLKQLLTEGEKYILSISSVSMHDQGVYEIVNNLGSLFARFLFQPLEEGFYLFFSRVEISHALHK